MSVVFVTNQVTTIDYSPLNKYGSVVFVTRGHHQPKDSSLIADIISMLIRSDPTDYLAITGHRLESSIVLAVWLQLHPSVSMFLIADQAWHLVTLDKSALRIQSETIRDQLPRRKDGSRV